MPWLARLRAARTRTEVLEVAREYVARLPAGEVALLPSECRPGKLATEEDLQEYAFRLVKHHGHGDDARAVIRLSEFFSRAAIRLAELASPFSNGPDDLGSPPKG
jgi:hypothetical protein